MTELTGKGKPFHSALDKAAGLLKRKVGTGAEFMQELKALGGVKQAEIEERKLAKLMGLPKMTHEQFMELLASNPVPAIKEKLLVDEDPDNEYSSEGEDRSYHEDYTMPRGENYREMLIKAPTFPGQKKMMNQLYELEAKQRRAAPEDQAALADQINQIKQQLSQIPEQFEGVAGHFGGERGILASMRLSDRFVPDLEGEHNVRVVGGGGFTNVKHPTREAAERFADVKHQGGFRTEITPTQFKKLLHLEELQSDWHQQGREKGYNQKVDKLPEGYRVEKSQRYDSHNVYNPEGELFASGMSPETATANAIDNLNRSGVPDAPFKKNWEEMALKRLIHHAAEKGYHGIVVTPGEEQADRYKLSKHVNQVEVYNLGDGLYNLEVIDKNGRPISIPNSRAITKDRISEIIGKDVANKALEQANDSGQSVLSGLDLNIGDKAMKKFYDEKVPNILNAVGKKHGVKTQLHGHQVEVKPAKKIPVMHERGIDYEGREVEPAQAKSVHHFPITEDMRKDILANGLPLYNEGGIIKKAQGGTVLPTLEQMKMELMKKAKPDFNDLRSIGVNEAPGLDIKAYIPPARDGSGQFPVGGVSLGNQPLPMGGVDLNKGQPGNQLMPANLAQPAPQAPQGGMPPQGVAGNTPPPPAGGSNILQMTPQGQAMAAMKPPAMATGGAVPPSPINNYPFQSADHKPYPFMAKEGGSYDAPMDNQSMDNGATTFNIDNIQNYADGGGTKGYVVHEPKKPHPEVGKRFKATPQGNLAKAKKFNIEKYENKGSIVPIPYDATTRDMLVSEVSGNQLQNPLLTEAGFDYSLDPRHIKENIGGASNLGIAGRVQKRVDQAGREHEGDVFLAPNTMGEDAENFSHHPAHIVLDLMAQRQLNKKTLKALSDDLRSQFEVVKTPNGNVKVFPYKNFVGFDHPNMMEQVMKGGHGLETTSGNLRKKLMERLGLVNMQKLLDYNLGDLKASILDPDIATDPKAYMGRTMVKAKVGAPLRLSSHSSYDTDYTGKHAGTMGGNRPLEILMPDVYTDIEKELLQRPAKTVKTPSQMRAQVVGALEKRKERFAQPINARVINNAGLYEEGLRNGEFDPKNVDSVLAYFKRKGGYKKGGKVKMSDNMDTINLELLNKRKKAK